MSAIAGIYHLDGQPSEIQQLRRMLDELAHRGKDDSGLWAGGVVALGHGMLWTTSESLLEKQPLSDAQGNFILTADARIDNREELYQLLELQQFPLAKITDSQLILLAYEKWGEKCPEKLLGDFAFALWDNRTHSLFCARDHMGVKPFYYYYQPGKFFAFASEIKALLSLSQVPKKINRAKVGIYLCQMNGYSAPTPETFQQNIFRLLPAHYLKISDRYLQLQSYWDVDEEASKISFNSDAEYVEAFQERFTQAVACRLRSVYPIFSCLSGGLDSSSVSCVARNGMQKQNSATELLTIYADCHQPSTDETEYVNAVLAQGGFKHHLASVTGALSSATVVTPYLAQPVEMPTPAMNLAMMRQIQQLGGRILLTGHDGDTIVSYGWDYVREIKSQYPRQLNQLFLKHLKIYRSISGITTNNLLEQNLIPREDIKVFKQNTIKANFIPRTWQKYNNSIAADFAEEINLDELVQKEFAYQYSYLPSEYLNHYRGLVSEDLQVSSEQLDAMYSNFYIEPRHPFLDKRLVELCLSVPGYLKFGSGLGRDIMRQAMTGILPETVRLRNDKVNFYGFIIADLLTNETELIEKLVFTEALDVNTYINGKILQEKYQDLKNPENDFDQKSRNARLISSSAYLSMWLN